MRTSLSAPCCQPSCSTASVVGGRRLVAPVIDRRGGAARQNLQLCRIGQAPGPGQGTPGSRETIADPENLYNAMPMQKGIIQKRLIEKQVKKSNQEFKMAIKLAEDDDRKEVLMRREQRDAPANKEELVEYFLSTVAEDMEYEVARHRPNLDTEFFAFLDKSIGEQRFLPALPGEGQKEEQEDRLGELTVLRQYLVAVCTAVDVTITRMASAKERMTKLLGAKDKKQMILDMAAENEIDQSLMDLLMTNIQAARSAEQEDAAKFMEKVMGACAKFFVAAPAPAGSQAPAPPQIGSATASAMLGAQPALGGGAQPPPPAAGGSRLIIPGRGGNMPAAQPPAPPPAKRKGPNNASGLIIDPKMRPT